MSVLVGNLLVVQTGGGTCAANASLAGVIAQSGRYPESIQEIYGSLNGFTGILEGRLVDLQEEQQSTIRALRHTPGAALGAGSLTLDLNANSALVAQQTTALFRVLEANNVRFLVTIGGMRTMEISRRLHEIARQRGYELRVIAIPKSATNDIPCTDHSPGFGSAARIVAHTVREAELDMLSHGEPGCSIVEVPGRLSGWLAVSAALARRGPEDAPDFILVPELGIDENALVQHIQATIERRGACSVVISEGVRNPKGRPFLAETVQADSVGRRLAEFIGESIGYPAYVYEAGRLPFHAVRLASGTDLKEAYEMGRDAVRSAINGQSGFMLKLKRESTSPYKCTNSLVLLEEVVQARYNRLPLEQLDLARLQPTEGLCQLLLPLIQGDPEIPLDENGLPEFARLSKTLVEDLIKAIEETPPAEPASSEPTQAA